ncbi:glycosyltransferase family 2 protein [Komagataeibacter melaceti]|uniref:Glycosyltransferase family 2 protein n=1 Tax=Komagataeibacter melaceti TaxID=2766577 RepID=A0A371Z531_9PROT|nr:glycosyltransferase family A protein [Komagataeibacter melaceti]RFD21577.1 glycosyltransferase family 2 protein [Komagataeibacter melaceti]
MHNSSAVATRECPVTVSIVVPCYDRMDLLERTLHACIGQTGVPEGLGWEIVVADNHPDRLARDVVARLQADSPVCLRHIPAGVRNIAHARNCGVAAAEGAFIAFVDDDEAPEPDWLVAHFSCLERTGADASFGPKYPVFAGGSAPDWDADGRFYTTDFHMKQDEGIYPLRWFPPQPRGLGTGNSMMRRATCLVGEAPFDEKLGRCGGEDTLLLLTLAHEKRRFVWCANARVWEFNEAGRMTFAYMCKRVQRSSRHSAMARLAIGHNSMTARMGIYGVALAQLVVYGALWLFRRRPADYLQICKALGKFGVGSLDFIPEPRASGAGVRA